MRAIKPVCTHCGAALSRNTSLMMCDACREAEIKAFTEPPQCHHLPGRKVKPNHPPVPPGCRYFRVCVEQAQYGNLVYDFYFPFENDGELLQAFEMIGIIPPHWKYLMASVAYYAWKAEEEKWAKTPVNDCKNFDSIAEWKAEAAKNAEAWRKWERGEPWE
jgi:hypothetical protein